MAETVDTLVTRIRADFQAAGFDAFSTKLDGILKESAGASLSLDELSRTARLLDQALAAARTDETRAQFAALAAQVRATENSMHDAATRGLGGVAGAAGGARQTMVDFGRTLNDVQQFGFSAQAGLIAISNNLDLMVSGFARAKQEAGSTRGALAAMVSSLAGPAGLVIGLNAATTAAVIFGPQIAAAFSGSATAADDAATSYRDALGALVQFEFESRRFSAVTAAQAQAEYDRAKAEQSRLQQEIRRLQGEAASLVRPQAQPSMTAQLFDPLGSFTVTDPDALRGLESRIQALRDDFGKAGERVEFFREALQRAAITARAFEDIGLTPDAPRTPPASRAPSAGRSGGRETADLVRDMERLAYLGPAVVAGLAPLYGPDAVTGGERQAAGIAAIAGALRDVEAVAGPAVESMSALQVAMLDGLRDGTLEATLALTYGLSDAFAGLVSLQDGIAEFGDNVVNALQDMVAAMVQAVAQALILQGVLALLNVIAPGAGSFVGAAMGVAGAAGKAGGLALAQTGHGPAQLAGGYVSVRIPVGVFPQATREGLDRERSRGKAGVL